MTHLIILGIFFLLVIIFAVVAFYKAWTHPHEDS